MLKCRRGFTLIELLVGVAIFTLLVSAGMGLFVSTLKAQRQGLARQELLDQTSYLMEYMSRAVRMAQKDMSGACVGAAKLNYAFENQCLKFVNYKDECQQFCLEDGRLKEVKSGNENFLTSGDLNAANFGVVLTGETQNDYLQPKVEINLTIEGKESSQINIKTTISQRNLDVRR